MNFPYFLAKRFSFQNTSGRRMRLGVKIASFGVAVGLAVMIISVSVVVGFKQEVSRQVIGFGSHIQVFSYGDTYTFDKSPIEMDSSTYASLQSIRGVERVEQIVSKPGVIKTASDFKGVVFKGVEDSYDFTFFQNNLSEGSLPDFAEKPNSVIISKGVARRLGLKVGDDIAAYFFQQKIRSRKFFVSGIYATSFSQFDDMFVVCNGETLRQLSQWEEGMVSSLEISVSDFRKVDEVRQEIHSNIGNRFDLQNLIYQIQTIKEIYPDIFGWLDMLNTNAYIIIILMMIVAGFNMIAGLLILILEKTQTIGLLKALGMSDSQIRKVFVINALFFVLKGMLWGNIVGLGLVLVEYFFHIIPMNPDFYYTDYAPVSLNLWLVAALNLGVLAVSILIMIVPSHIITKISPAKSIKFE